MNGNQWYSRNFEHICATLAQTLNPKPLISGTLRDFLALPSKPRMPESDSHNFFKTLGPATLLRPRNSFRGSPGCAAWHRIRSGRRRTCLLCCKLFLKGKMTRNNKNDVVKDLQESIVSESLQPKSLGAAFYCCCCLNSRAAV